MLRSLRQRKVVRVVFDESHSEAWSIRPEVAAGIHPEHPAASSYEAAATLLSRRDFEVDAHTAGPLSDEVLADADVLVLAHPSDPRWERTVDGGSPQFLPAEVEAIARFVERGGGLVVLGEEEEDKYGSNLNEVLDRFGVHIDNTTVFDYASNLGSPTWVLGEPVADPSEPALLHLVDQVCFYRAGTLATHNGGTLLRTSAAAQPPGAGLLATAARGDGRVVAVADSDLFGDDYLDRLRPHAAVAESAVLGVADPPSSPAQSPSSSAAADDPHWRRLKDETNALRALQEPKGEVDLAVHDQDAVRGHVEAMVASIEGLAPRFPHQQEYLLQVVADLRAWVEAGCAKPDFMASLALFRPEQHRKDGIEHLVVFPMYTPNGSPDTRFEALIVRTPWPEFIDQLERGMFDNQKYVPVQLVDYTDGYDSECAVLFPETVSVATRPTNNFGGIFCDREAARFQRAVEGGAEVLRIELPPDAAALASNGDLVRETYILWDMIHDRWHSHGDLPFDPFMIRQRLPYWMYSLEELRGRPRHLRQRRRAGEGRLPLRALRAVRDPVRPHPALSDHR